MRGTQAVQVEAGLKVGGLFNPFNQFKQFVIIPEGVFQHDNLSQGAKLCYGRLLRYAGRTCFCVPGVTTLSTELGVIDRTVQGYLKELVDHGFIRKQARSGKRGQTTNQYLFVVHPSFKGKLKTTVEG
jgi:helix-turn-helix protein